MQITTSREMDSQLPRRVTVQHLDYDREYNTGSQYAERLNTAAINKSVLDLPIVLTATEAAGKSRGAAVSLLARTLRRGDHPAADLSAARTRRRGDARHAGGQRPIAIGRSRLPERRRVQCKAKYANAAIYTPTAVASPSVPGRRQSRRSARPSIPCSIFRS